MYEYELFEFKTGFGYNILSDGIVTIHQEYMPEVNGLVIMTRDEAISYAEQTLKRVE